MQVIIDRRNITDVSNNFSTFSFAAEIPKNATEHTIERLKSFLIERAEFNTAEYALRISKAKNIIVATKSAESNGQKNELVFDGKLFGKITHSQPGKNTVFISDDILEKLPIIIERGAKQIWWWEYITTATICPNAKRLSFSVSYTVSKNAPLSFPDFSCGIYGKSQDQAVQEIARRVLYPEFVVESVNVDTTSIRSLAVLIRDHVTMFVEKERTKYSDEEKALLRDPAAMSLLPASLSKYAKIISSSIFSYQINNTREADYLVTIQNPFFEASYNRITREIRFPSEVFEELHTEFVKIKPLLKNYKERSLYLKGKIRAYLPDYTIDNGKSEYKPKLDVFRYHLQGKYPYSIDIPATGAYKHASVKAIREAQDRLKEKSDAERTEFIRSQPLIGNLAAFVVVDFVSSNPDLTTTSVIKLLQGQKVSTWVYQHCNQIMFQSPLRFLSQEYVKDVVKGLIKSDVLRTTTRKGEYGKFETIHVTKNGALFLEYSMICSSSRIDDCSECEVWQRIRDDALSASDKKHICDYLTEHPAVFGAEINRCIELVQQNASDAFIEYVKMMSQIADSAVDREFYSALELAFAEDAYTQEPDNL